MLVQFLAKRPVFLELLVKYFGSDFRAVCCILYVASIYSI